MHTPLRGKTAMPTYRPTLLGKRTFAPHLDEGYPLDTYDADKLKFSPDGRRLAVRCNAFGLDPQHDEKLDEFEDDVGYDEWHVWMDVWDVERMALIEEDVPWDELGFMAGERRAELGEYEAEEVDVVSTDGTLYATRPPAEPLITIRRLFTNEFVARSPERHRFSAISFSPNGKVLFVDDHEGRGYIWSYLENKMVPLQDDEKYMGRTKVFSAVNDLIAGTNSEYDWPKHHLLVWNSVSGERMVDHLLPDMPPGYLPQVLACTPAGGFILNLSTQNEVKMVVFDVNDRTLSSLQLEGKTWPYLMTFSPQGNILATIDGYHTLAFWEWKAPR